MKRRGAVLYSKGKEEFSAEMSCSGKDKYRIARQRKGGEMTRLEQ